MTFSSNLFRDQIDFIELLSKYEVATLITKNVIHGVFLDDD
jgi:hypothetical protein